jgi:hypothetical protein
MQYELNAAEIKAVDRIRMTPEEVAAEEQKQRDSEEEQLRTRLGESEYAAVLAFRAKVAAQTDAERTAEHCLFMQNVIVESLKWQGVSEAAREVITKGGVSAEVVNAFQSIIGIAAESEAR